MCCSMEVSYGSGIRWVSGIQNQDEDESGLCPSTGHFGGERLDDRLLGQCISRESLTLFNGSSIPSDYEA